MVLWASLLRGQLAEYLMMARHGAVFVGVVAFFAAAAWQSNNTSRLDFSVLGQPIGPVAQEACLGWSMEQTVPGRAKEECSNILFFVRLPLTTTPTS